MLTSLLLADALDATRWTGQGEVVLRSLVFPGAFDAKAL